MKHKIAIITTDFLSDYIQHAFSKLNLDCSYELFIYKTFRDIPDLIPQISKDVTGILTSGSFPAQVIRLSYPDLPYIIMPFNTDDESICHLFLRLLDEDRTLDFNRISEDVISIHNVELRTYLRDGVSYSLAATADQVVSEKTLEELYQIENYIFNHHMHLWNDGQIDLCVTRFSSLVEPLREAGIKVLFPYPSIVYINDVCQKLFKEIEYRTLQEHCPASIAISVIPMSGNQEQLLFSMEHHTLLLQSALIEFLGDSNLEYVFRRTDSALEIVTQQKNVNMLTENRQCCKIQNFLKQKAGHKFFIGYGLGWNLEHARMNALNALQKAESFRKSTSFIMDADNKLMGPLRPAENISSPVPKTPKSSASFSHEKKKEVLTIIRSFPNHEATSQDLADKMQVTKRSANRILSAMLNEHLIEIARTQTTAAKGRPERIYRPAKLQ